MIRKNNISRENAATLILLMFIALLLTPACIKKQNELSIEGSIYDPVLNIALSGVSVNLSSKKVSSGVYSSGYQHIATVYSDSEGKFFLTVEKEKTQAYRFVIKKDDYFELEEVVNPEHVEIQPYIASFEMLPQSTFRLRIKNNNPWNNQDQITWQINNAELKCWDCCNNHIYKRTGSNYDTTLVCKTIGNRSLILTTSSTKNNSTLIRIDTIFFPVFQTVEHDVFY